MSYKPLIVQNKRNIKNESKLITLNKQEKEIYKKRPVIERTFNRMKMNRKICLRYLVNKVHEALPYKSKIYKAVPCELRSQGTKISLITDAHGTPFNVECYKGNEYDSRILLKQLKNDSSTGD
jgi:transposase